MYKVERLIVEWLDRHLTVMWNSDSLYVQKL